jgi:hypothetical protein
VTAALQLTQDAFIRHLALEMLDRAVKSAVSDHDFYRLALNGLSNHHAGPSEANGALPYTKRGRAQVLNGRAVRPPAGSVPESTPLP